MGTPEDVATEKFFTPPDDELASQHYKCAECGLEVDITEDNPNFPNAKGWELIEDQAMVELGAKPYWLCPECASV